MLPNSVNILAFWVHPTHFKINPHFLGKWEKDCLSSMLDYRGMKLVQMLWCNTRPLIRISLGHWILVKAMDHCSSIGGIFPLPWVGECVVVAIAWPCGMWLAVGLALCQYGHVCFLVISVAARIFFHWFRSNKIVHVNLVYTHLVTECSIVMFLSLSLYYHW